MSERKRIIAATEFGPPVSSEQIAEAAQEVGRHITAMLEFAAPGLSEDGLEAAKLRFLQGALDCAEATMYDANHMVAGRGRNPTDPPVEILPDNDPRSNRSRAAALGQRVVGDEAQRVTRMLFGGDVRPRDALKKKFGQLLTVQAKKSKLR